jgi:hypothetical protein
MTAICNKIFAKPQRQVIERIRKSSLRRLRVQEFASAFVSKFEEGFFREAARLFFSNMVGLVALQRMKNSGAYEIFQWVKVKSKDSVR